MATLSLQPPLQGNSVKVAHLALNQNELGQYHLPLPYRLAELKNARGMSRTQASAIYSLPKNQRAGVVSARNVNETY